MYLDVVDEQNLREYNAYLFTHYYQRAWNSPDLIFKWARRT